MSKTSTVGISLNLTALVLLALWLSEPEQKDPHLPAKTPVEQAEMTPPKSPLEKAADAAALAKLSFVSSDRLESWSEQEKPSVSDTLQNNVPEVTPLVAEPQKTLPAIQPASYSPEKERAQENAKDLKPMTFENSQTPTKSALQALKPVGTPLQEMAGLSPLKALAYHKPEAQISEKPEQPEKIDLAQTALTYHTPEPKKIELKPVFEKPLARAEQNRAEDRPGPEMKDVKIPVKAPAPASSKKQLNPPSQSQIRQAQSVLENADGANGLSMTFVWPKEDEMKIRVHRVLENCYGMRLGMLNDAGQLYLSSNGKASASELRFYSPLLRLVNNAVNQDEVHKMRQLNFGLSGQAVRLFPRRLDAYILASLKQALPSGQDLKGQFAGIYQMKGGKAVLGSLRLNGRPIEGELILPAAQAGCL